MKKFALTAFAAAAALSLAGCGKSDDAADQATPDNVEMPADELPAAATSLAAPPPVADPAADASEAAMSAEQAARSNADAAMSAAEAAKAAAAEAEQAQPKTEPQQ